MTLLKAGNRTNRRNNKKCISLFELLRPFTQRHVMIWEKILKGNSFLDISLKNC